MPLRVSKSKFNYQLKWVFLFVSVTFFVIILINNYVIVKSEIIKEDSKDCYQVVKTALDYQIDARLEDCRVVINPLLLTNNQFQYKIDLDSLKKEIEIKEAEFEKKIEINELLIGQKKAVLTQLNLDFVYQIDQTLPPPIKLEEQNNFIKRSDLMIKNKLDNYDYIWNQYLILNDSLALNYPFSKSAPEIEDDKIKSYQSLIDFIKVNSDLYNSRNLKPELNQLFKYKFLDSKDFVENSNKFSKDLPTSYPFITGNLQIDREIIDIAISRGYKPRSQISTESLEELVDSPTPNKYLLTPQAKIAYQKMNEAARNDGIQMQLSSAYRSNEDQRSLFLTRFNQNYNNIAGRAFVTNTELDLQTRNAIIKTLEMTAPPGYSKHHLGITIDLIENPINGRFRAFVDTEAFDWLSKNNYFNAKRFGFVPSYPEGVDLVGPEPEAWEYVYVSTEELSI
jgi:D-alanyl-D-alanine carboxypeptidase